MPRNYEHASPEQYQRRPEHTRDWAWVCAFLGRSLIGQVAHSRVGQPFITPTNFWFDEAKRRIIFHSNISGRLRDNLEHNPQVCFETSEYGRFLPANTALEFSIQFRSAMVFGPAGVLENDEEKRLALYSFLKKYFPKLSPGVEYRPITDKELARTTVYAIHIETWSGKENWPEQADQLPDWPPLPEKFLNSK